MLNNKRKVKCCPKCGTTLKKEEIVDIKERSTYYAKQCSNGHFPGVMASKTVKKLLFCVKCIAYFDKRDLKSVTN